MVFFYEVPIIVIVFIVLGLLGMDISIIAKWIMRIIGIVGIIYGICIGLDPWDNKERIVTIIAIILGIALIILSNYIGHFSLIEILDRIF